MFEAVQLVSKNPKAKSSSAFVPAASPRCSDCVITSECGRGSEDDPAGDTQERE